jgi:hypothetical protein
LTGNSVNKTDDAVWSAFEALAKTYPDDNGVRLTADLSRWMLQEGQRLGLPTPPTMRRVADAAPSKLHGGKDLDIDALLKLHLDAWGRLAELIGICTQQRNAGNLKVVPEAFAHARRLLDEIHALEQMASPARR